MNARTGTGRPVSLAEFQPLPEGPNQYPLEFMENSFAIKLREEADSVMVGMCDPSDRALRERLSSFHGKPLTVVAIDRSELAVHLGRISGAEPGAAGDPGGLRPDGAGGGSTAAPGGARGSEEEERLLLDRLAHDAPVVNLVNSLLIEGVRRGASDIHIESFSREVRVRYRIDGVLETAQTLRSDLFRAVSSRVKIIANLNIMERRLPQDGRITADIGGKSVDMRVSIVPIAHGESIVLRLFNRQDAALTLDSLGLPRDQIEALRALAAAPHGLFLVTGPTGSGKTTTLNALLKEMRSDSRKIVSIEDPVEYVMDGIDQIQTNERIGLTFESLLRRVLRQDPDVIMVGEIRDGETAELAVRAALTGHLVLSTLHTNDAVSAVTRLTDIGVQRYLTAAVLRSCMAQRLVRRICGTCRTGRAPREEERLLLEHEGFDAGTLYEGTGCESCGGTGYRGRIAVSELFGVDRALERLLASGADGPELAEYLRRTGMKTIRETGFELALRGETTLDDVKAVTF